MARNDVSLWTEMMGVEFRQRYFDAGGVRTRCIEAGQGHPLVMLHGGGGHAEAYFHNIPELSKHFHVHAIDMLGHGFTEGPERDRWSFNDLVAHLRDLQDAIGADRIYLTGMSIGAMTSALYAGRYPDRVSKLLLNTGVPLRADEQGREMFRRDIDKFGKAAQTGWNPDSVRTRLGILFENGVDDVPDELIAVRHKIYTEQAMTNRYGRLVNSLLREIAEETTFNQVDGPQALRNIACPTLVLWTEKNPGQNVEVAKDAMKLLKDGRLVIFEHSGHWPQWEESEQYNRVAIEFFNS